MKLEEAIDICKNKICDDVISDYCQMENQYCKSLCENSDCYLRQAIETVLQVLESLQNKNDKLIQKTIEYDKTLEKLQKETISKKKIEGKIEELESKIPKDINCANDYDLDNEVNYKLEVLQELLEDK